MVKIRERYIWIAFFVVVAAISVYFKMYFNSPISLSVSMPSFNSSAIYPYQSVAVPILINNTGALAFTNLTFGLSVNGNTTTVYKASVPAGKHVTINYTFFPTSSGTYTIALVADASKLYNIANRQSAQTSTIIIVLPQEKLEPYTNFATGAVSQDLFKLSISGFLSSLLFDNFTNKLYLTTGSQSVNNFLYPAIEVYSDYIKNITIAHAYYGNYSLASMWISGPLGQNALTQVAVGKGLNISYIGNGTSVIDLGSNTTICSWYSGGWTKALVSIFGKSCKVFLNKTGNTFNYSASYYMLKNRNSSILDYSGFNGNLLYSGDISVQNKSIVYEGLENGVNFSNKCYSNILNLSGNSYCESSLISGNYILTEVNRHPGDYNVSVWSISEANDSLQVAAAALNLSGSYKIPGPGMVFVSAFVSQCFLANGIPCANPKFSSTSNTSSLILSVVNNLNGTVMLNGLTCSSYGNATETKLHVSIAQGHNTTISTPCYNAGKMITNLTPIHIIFSLMLNYTLGTSTTNSQGYVEISK